MRVYEFLVERISSRVFHYTRVPTALKILQSGRFELSHTLGTSWEAQFAPKGYPYFLSTTRTRHGGYHGWLGQDAVLFELDGDFYNQRYPGKAVDYWNNRDPAKDHHKAHEAEDRIFSREPSIPAAIRAIDLYIEPDADEAARARTRQVIILAKKAGIPVNLFNDQAAWRQRDTRKTADVGQLRGQDPARGYVSSRRGGYLKPWMELMQAKTKAQLSKDADRKRYDLQYTYDRQGLARSLAVDLSNARKPGPDADRNNAIRIIKFMQQNRLATVDDFVNYLADKWKNLNEAAMKEPHPQLHFPGITLILHPHLFDQIRLRGVSQATMDYLIGKVPGLVPKLREFEPGQKIWINSVQRKSKIGLRRGQNGPRNEMRYYVMTAVKNPTWNNPDPSFDIDTVPQQSLGGTGDSLKEQDLTTENIAGRNKKRVYDLLVNAIGSGPFDGGCVVVAQAIQARHGGDIVVLVGPSQKATKAVAQHAAVKIGNQLVDFDGPLPMQEFVRRFERNELAHSGGHIVAVRPIQSDDLPDAPRDSKLAHELSRIIK